MARLRSFWQLIFAHYAEMDSVMIAKKKILFIGLVYMWVHFSIAIFFLNTSQAHKMTLFVAWVANIFTIYLLCRKKGITVAVYVLSISWLVNVTSTAWRTGGIYSTGMIWQLLLIFILLTYLDRKAGVWATVYVILNYAVFFYLQYAGIKNFRAEVQLNPPYYELISITSLYLILTFAIVYVYTQDNFDQAWKTEKEVKIDELQVELDRRMSELGMLRNNIARDFHDEMGNKLASIRLLSENIALKSDKNLLEKADMLDSLHIIETRSKELFEGTKDFIWSIGTNSDNILSFFDYIRGFSEKFLNELDINFDSNYSIPAETTEKIAPDSARQLIFVLKEIVTNAAKHSKATNVHLKFTIENSQLIITISDNGLGFDTNLSRSNGLLNIELRLNKIDATFKLNSSADLGTHYTIFTPLMPTTKNG
jgi:signal transduction histidine kinase